MSALSTALPATSTAASHHYTVRVDRALAQVSVTACLANGAKSLRAGARGAERHLSSALSLPSRENLALDATRLTLKHGDSCLKYTASLEGMIPQHRRYAQLSAKSAPVPVSSWLWLPHHANVDIEISFVLPQGHNVSVPWTKLPARGDQSALRFRLPPSPQSDEAMSVFGEFETCDVHVHGAALRVAALPGKQRGDSNELFHWVREAARNVTLAYGRFPNPAPQVILIPVAKHPHDREEPVPFGHVIRDGGEAVQFFVNQQRPLAEFVGDWTATHEFAHLMLPYINADENWISEGLASYYQNVLMARAGRYSAAKAWRKIVEGFRRGEKAVPHLSLEDAMPKGSWDGIMKTYWGGAAIFLMADVELRVASEGRVTLDTVLARLQACCLPSSRTWHGTDFFSTLDTFTPHPLFMRLYHRYRAQSEFPAYDEIIRQLGISLENGRARLRNDAPLSLVREAITAKKTTPAVVDSCSTTE